MYISSRSIEACEKVAHELSSKGPGQCFALPADLAKLSEVHRLVSELQTRETRKNRLIFDKVYKSWVYFWLIFLFLCHVPDLDVLVNNAGATWGESFQDYPDEAFDKVLTLNLKRVFSLTQA